MKSFAKLVGAAALSGIAVVTLLATRGTAATQAQGGDTPLNRALDSVRADRILADVFYVACDDMGGRDTPSTGQHLTARFIKNRLQRIGWKPGAGRPGAKDPWFYTYPLSYKRVKEPETRGVLQKGEQRVALTFGTDYFFNARELDNVETSGDLVFCGRGTKEDFAAAPAVRGKWAVCFDGGDNLRGIEERAAPAGAIGVVAIAAPNDPKAPNYVETLGRMVSFMRTGRVQSPEAGGEKKAVFPRVSLAAAAVEKLWQLAGINAPVPGQELGVSLTDTRRLVGDGTVECEDVVGFWPGSDPKLSQEVILCTAHYDHVGTTADGVVYNGADDNGSGTCGLLALAEALVVHGPMRRSVMLIWVSGEEKGLLGSEAWAKAPFFPNDGHAIADINTDMVGRNNPNQILITPTKAHAAYNGLVKMAERLAPLESFTEIKSADEYYTRSDHAMFAKLGIPVTFFFADIHADYHKPTDDPEKIDGDKIRRVMRLVLRMLDEMQADTLELGK